MDEKGVRENPYVQEEFFSSTSMANREYFAMNNYLMVGRVADGLSRNDVSATTRDVAMNGTNNRHRFIYIQTSLRIDEILDKDELCRFM